MTRKEALRISKRLQSLVGLHTENVTDWLALIEDELIVLLPDKPNLVAQFQTIKDEATKKSRDLTLSNEETQLELCQETRKRIRPLIDDVCSTLETGPFLPDDLREEIELVIQRGYFKSIYFRLVVGGLSLVLLLVTGIEGYRLNEQVKAMQALVENARRQVEQSNREVEQARNETTKRQAELALLILEGDAAIVDARTKAISHIEDEGRIGRSQIQKSESDWDAAVSGAGETATESIEKAKKKAEDQIAVQVADSIASLNQTAKNSIGEIASISEGGKKELKTVFLNSQRQLEAVKNPWIPQILWSIAKTWALGPLALIVGVFSFIFSVRRSADLSRWSRLGIVATMLLLLFLNLAATK